MANSKKLLKAKEAKYDEFYTQYEDIQEEVNAYLEYDPNVFRDKTILLPCDDPEWSNFTKFFAQNFEEFGLKKLISTSYSLEKKTEKYSFDYQLSLFETNSPQFDIEKSQKKGKIFTLSRKGRKKKIDIDSLEWKYLKGDGDFRSEEVKKLRDEADIIITNPPFSLYRDFVAWLFEANKKFLIIANKSSVTMKEIFPLIRNNLMWSGKTSWSGGLWFETMNYEDVDRVDNGRNMKNTPSVWFTNLEHGRRHQPLQLMTMEENLKYSKHKLIRNEGYLKYDLYDVIRIPFTDSIPRDYDGAMAVPISFLEKYNPEQFEILSCNEFRINEDVPFKEHGLIKDKEASINGEIKFASIVIRFRR